MLIKLSAQISTSDSPFPNRSGRWINAEHHLPSPLFNWPLSKTDLSPKVSSSPIHQSLYLTPDGGIGAGNEEDRGRRRWGGGLFIGILSAPSPLLPLFLITHRPDKGKEKPCITLTLGFFLTLCTAHTPGKNKKTTNTPLSRVITVRIPATHSISLFAARANSSWNTTRACGTCMVDGERSCKHLQLTSVGLSWRRFQPVTPDIRSPPPRTPLPTLLPSIRGRRPRRKARCGS